jgi:hypothetical protein
MEKNTFRAAPVAGSAEDAAMPYLPDGEGDTAAALVDSARRRHEPALLAIDGVEGVASGRTVSGDDAIVVYVRDDAARRLLPRQIEGFAVEIALSGPIDASPG